jgi:hypothetical protein
MDILGGHDLSFVPCSSDRVEPHPAPQPWEKLKHHEFMLNYREFRMDRKDTKMRVEPS